MDSAALDVYRLPTDATPVHYDLKIRTELRDASFDGTVGVTVHFNVDTSRVVLNVFELELGTTSIVFGTHTFHPTSQDIDTVTQRATFTFPTVFSRGSTAVLRVTFRGKLGNSGFLKSEWEHDGVTENYSATFFEPTFARRAFPCWDEPQLKATFAVSLISRTGTVNLSNMPSFFEGPYDPAQDPLDPAFSADKVAAEWITTRFETTPKMSTYIVAFASGPFAHLESSFTSPLTGRVVPLRIYSTPDYISQGQFALDLTAQVLPIYERMFDLEYPLPKLDLITVRWLPISPSNCALENWGLIVASPDGFLFDPVNDSTQTKKRVVNITAHELAHQWFGNIVTMAWWDNLLYPEWKGDSAFVDGPLKRAFEVDGKLSSHPVEVECPDANHVTEIFDAISYMKSAATLRMLSSLLGEELFFKGVSLYLKEHRLGNSVAADLWDALGRASGTCVWPIEPTDLVSLTGHETGYPVITVAEVQGGIRIRQNRFLNGGPAEAKNDETIWTIPLNILTVGPDGTSTIDKTAFLSEREMFIPIDTRYPFKLNASSTAFYRVLYASPNLNKLAVAAAKGNISDRVGLMNDAMALATANLAKLSSALTLIDGFAGETEYIVLAGIAENINGLLAIWWENPTVVQLLQSLTRELFVPLVADLGYQYLPDESTDAAAVRTLAIKQAAYAGDSNIVAELQARFAHFLATGDDSLIPPDLAGAIYKVAVRHGGRPEYERVREILKTTSPPRSRVTARPFLIAETVEGLLQESDGNFDWLLCGLSYHPAARRPLIAYFKKHFDEIEKRFDGSGFEHYSQLPFKSLTTERDYDETVAFFKTKDTSKYVRSLEQTLEAIRTNIRYLERSTGEITEWLEAWRQRNQARAV
ncbi:peptidase family M1-domain-containing protein [Mycena sp. CBHHK59/15]|nr:peptidase family M1-domain-containing protein [Mycena sp. CBHHK59/15]